MAAASSERVVRADNGVFDPMANVLRALAIDAVQQANSGHPGAPMGMAEMAVALWHRNLKHSPANPQWPDRDRFVLSNGHASMLLYALLHLSGYDLPLGELKRFRQLHSKTPGHPEVGLTPGVETTTGPLGQGLANAVGMALAEKLLAGQFNRPGHTIVDHHTFVFAGDGCLMEGISHEACSLAGVLGLSKLVVLYDDNGISIDGAVAGWFGDDTAARFRAYGWHVIGPIDGHDIAAVAAAIAEARSGGSATGGRPVFIICRTTIGRGSPGRAGTAKAHGEPLGADEIKGAREKLGWPHAPFEVPEAVRAAWQSVAERGALARTAWQKRLEASGKKAAFTAQFEGGLPAEVTTALDAYKQELAATAPKIATRKASEMVLGVINAATDLTVGGSADLSHSNLTLTKGMASVAARQFAGRYGVREHAMAAAMNGIALHGGFIPYGGTFMCFADYARGAIRLSALMGQRVIYVMTHDSIGLGEDGPTHQPIEHLAMLRATPNLLVMRPADAVETLECWQIALSSRTTPSVLALSRQALAPLRTSHSEENLCARGAYVLKEVKGQRAVTLLATGSEVEIAIAAADLLTQKGIAAAVVSMPCWELFERQDIAYQRKILGTAPRVAVEAACRLGWDRWIGERGRFVGMTGFGASAPAPALYRHFGITADTVAAAASSAIEGNP
jgi:transketolase